MYLYISFSEDPRRKSRASVDKAYRDTDYITYYFLTVKLYLIIFYKLCKLMLLMKDI